RGLLSARYVNSRAASGLPSSVMRSRDASVGRSASCCVRPSTAMRPSAIQRAACVRDAMPSLEITRASPWRGAGLLRAGGRMSATLETADRALGDLLSRDEIDARRGRPLSQPLGECVERRRVALGHDLDAPILEVARMP